MCCPTLWLIGTVSEVVQHTAARLKLMYKSYTPHMLWLFKQHSSLIDPSFFRPIVTDPSFRLNVTDPSFLGQMSPTPPS